MSRPFLSEFDDYLEPPSDDLAPECKRCGNWMEFVECGACAGEGGCLEETEESAYTEEEWQRCDMCSGEGGWWVCPDAKRHGIDEIRERWAKATPGPWRWAGNTSGKSLELVSLRHGRWLGDTVMAFRRWGLQRAQPVFTIDGLLRPAIDFFIRPQPHNDWLVRGIDHPDAIAIESAPADIAALLAYIDELETHRAS